jgi:hypothetical protein
MAKTQTGPDPFEIIAIGVLLILLPLMGVIAMNVSTTFTFAGLLIFAYGVYRYVTR